MPSLTTRVRKRFTLFLLIFSSIKLPEQTPLADQYRLAWEETTLNGGRNSQLLSSFLSLQFVGYGLVLLALLAFGFLAAVDLVFKSVFIACSVVVHWATSECRIRHPPKPDYQDPSSSCVNVWIHGVGEHRAYLIHDFPCQAECKAIYSFVSQLLGIPSELLTLYSGVKILQRSIPLRAYTSDLNLTHGLSLYCSIKIFGGGSDDEGDDESKTERSTGATKNPHTVLCKLYNPALERPTLSELQRLGVPYQIGSNYKEFGIFLLQECSNTIERHYRVRGFKAVYLILRLWLKGEGIAVTWTSLIQALRECGNYSLADDIQAIKGDSSLQEAMKDGCIEVTLRKVTLSGTAGVGKTCVYHLLLDLDPPDKRTSTECAKRPIRLMQVGEREDGKWEKVSLKQMVAEAVPILCKRLKKTVKEQGTLADTETEERTRDEEESKRDVPKRKKSQLDAVIEEVVVELDQLVIQHISIERLFRETQELSLEKKAIYFTDCGGQQAFWDLAPIFIHGPSTIIFVHRLCDKLDDKPSNDWYKEGKIVGPSQQATFTTAEALKLMCRGLESDDESKLLVVGTHKDIYEAEKQHDETIDCKNKKFETYIPEKAKVYCDEGMSKVIFEVNAISPGREEKDIAREIRGKVGQSAQRHVVPMSWYVLQIVLEEVAKRLERHIFLISECETVAKELSFDLDEMKAALRFLDRLNIFFYKEAILPGVVFTSSQVPLNAVTRLVEKRYQLLEAKDKPSGRCKPTDGMWLQFRNQAKITLEHLQDEIFQPLNEEGIFTEETFLHLLKSLQIVAPVSDSPEYFCPVLLDMVEVDQFLKKYDEVTRVFHFSGGYAPPGVFCCAVCYLQSSSWKIREKDVVARNQITFVVYGRKVTFIDKFQFFTVSISQGDVSKDWCKRIHYVIFDAIQYGLVITHNKTALFGMSFLCPCTDHEALHPAIVEQLEGDDPYLVCTKEDLKSGVLNKHQEVWHNSRCSRCLGAMSKPNIRDLSNKVLPRVSSKIDFLAIRLGLEMYEFDIIKRNNASDVRLQTLQVFDKWQRKDENYTWGYLIGALRSPAVQLSRLAKELEDWLQC